MQRIDAHQHFWQYRPVRDSWITDDMQLIRKNFLPGDLLPVLQQAKFDGCVVVQSDQSEEENEFQLKNAEQFDFIKGVVGWVDLQNERIEERLARYAGFKKMKGFRHVLQGEADRALMLRPAFKNGISLLHKYNFTYDILIFPDQLKYSTQLAAQFPEQPFVIDHLAKPLIRDKKITEWKQDIESIALQQNVCCKISGMVTEADWKQWKKEDLYPYLDVVVQAFGIDRIMFGSDWPVCLVAASYTEWVNLLEEYFSSFTAEERLKFFGLNAIEFYNLK